VAKVAQQRPGRRRLPVAVRDRDELLLPVEAHADDDETAQAVLLETDVEVDPVDRDIDVVSVGDAPAHERPVFSLPSGGQPGDHRG